ncbi:MAG: polysaccharide biosynthesis tyrosine autokinase [Nostocales cyanobacterium 94392]|nr:polysaccharide biosynthesis tyrosine autokinase [Nostocales cyanobacterium 94392]
MQNTSSQPLNANLNGHSAPRFLPPEPFGWNEMEENDWDLSQFLGLLKRRALVIAGVATTVMAGVSYKTLTQVPQYESNFRLLVEPVDEKDQNNLSKLTSALDANLGKSGLDYETQIEVLKSPELMNSIVEELQRKYPDITYENLIKDNALNIIRLGETKIIEVRYQNDSPTQIKEVLDTVARNYLKYSLEKRQTQLNQGIRFVEKELPPVKKQVDTLQQQLQAFRQEYEFFDPSTNSSQVSEQLKLLAEQRQGVEQELAKAKANFVILQQEQGALAVLKDAAVYQQLVTQLQQLETQIAEESTRFQDDAPIIKRLQEKREKLLPLLQQEGRRILNLTLSEAANQVQILEVQSQQLSAAEQQLSQQINQLPALARRYTELAQNLQIANESLNRFLTTRQNLQIEAAQTELPWELIKAAVKPEEPVSPNIQRNLILGFVASVLLAIGAALLREKLDNTYHNAEALKDDLKLPLLGVLPIDKNLQKHQQRTSKTESSQDIEAEDVTKLVPMFHPESTPSYFQESGQFVEAVRIIHTNLQMLSSDRQIRSIVISSALPGDGKSTVAYNLAQVAASMGQKVLLVDTDLRRPQLHAQTGLSNLWGLSNLISGNMPAEQVMQDLPDFFGCSVITSGPIPPDATRLLSSVKMKQLVAEFHQKFDFVIYDSPPLVGLADVTLLAPYTDGIVLVVRMDQTERSIVKQTVDSLKTSQTSVLGVVANGDKTRFNKYYHKYYHS